MNKDTQSENGGIASLNASSAVGVSGKVRKSRAKRLQEAVEKPPLDSAIGIEDQTSAGKVTITVEPTVSKLDSFFQAKQRATVDSSRNLGSSQSSRRHNNVSIVERLRGSSRASD
jgi:hypothetical protein